MLGEHGGGVKALHIPPQADMVVALRDLFLGEEVEGMRLRTPVAARHKFFLRDLPGGAYPRFYGAPAGVTLRPVLAGAAATSEKLGVNVIVFSFYYWTRHLLR